MVQTRSASGVDVPATPVGSRTRASETPAPSTRRTAAAAANAAAVPSVLTRTRKSTTPSHQSAVASSSAAASAWVHVPDVITLLWLAVSLPLVAWDTGYVLLRPHTMPGGALHWPLWAPYALYGEVDHVYGFKQWHARNGFTAAQGALNLLETLLYLGYVYLWWAKGATTPTTTSGGGRKGVTGRAAAYAVMLAFSAAVMTLSKTVLYWLNEYFSYFDNIGHNDLYSLVFLWIIPNGLWLVFPTYVIYQLGGEIVNVLAGASADDEKEE